MDPTETTNNDKLPSGTKPKVNTRKKAPPSKQRRNDSRRAASNKPKLDSISTEIAGKLNIGSSSNMSVDPAVALTPGAVHVNLLGTMDFIDSMLKRFVTIARRPLANLLLVPENVERYKRVCNTLLTLRIAAAQDKHPYVRGTTLSLTGIYTAIDYKTVDDYCTTGIPTPLAWALSHIGTFKQDEVEVIPNLIFGKDPTIGNLKHGSFPAICGYVAAHAIGAAGIDIPADDQVWLTANRHIIPNRINANRFTADTVALWNNETGDYFEAFTSINSALKEQHLTLPNVSISAAVGSDAQTLRITQYNAVNSREIPFYSTLPLSTSSVRAGLCLRLGQNAFIPADQLHQRFLCDFESALLKGNDVPSVFVNGQLDMLNQ